LVRLLLVAFPFDRRILVIMAHAGKRTRPHGEAS
jgi:hypothetical protein